MPRLIHLNGPSRVGKSTLARRYADDHPGTLDLDLDVLVGLVGGWQEDFSAALGFVRGHGLAMAARHLELGHDVVVPQLVTVHDRGNDVEDTARAVGATYVEVALLLDATEHEARLAAKRPTTEVEHRIQELLTDPGSDLVSRIRGHLDAYLDGRPATHRIDTTGQGADQTYRDLLALLD